MSPRHGTTSNLEAWLPLSLGVNKVRFCWRGLLFTQVLLIGHVQLQGTPKSRLLYLNVYSISCLPGGISKDVI